MTSTAIAMAQFISYILLPVFVICCVCSPIKRFTNQETTDCYGTDCYYYDLDTAAVTEIVFPVNLTDSIVTHLPTIAKSQEDLVTVLDKRLASILDSHTDNHNQMARALQFIQTSQESSQNLTTRVLQSIQESQTSGQNQLARALQSIQEGQDRMLEKMSGLFESITNQLLTQQVTLTGKVPHKDCKDIYDNEALTRPALQIINPVYGRRSYVVYCSDEWTVIQHRFDGSVNFYREWQDYVDGFGDPNGEHWVGLELIHLLTKTGTWQLKIELEDFDGSTAHAYYNPFSVGGSDTNYALSLEYSSGTSGDALTGNNNTQFSTKDRDNDKSNSLHCAQNRRGGWWYVGCTHANLNGQYEGGLDQDTLTGMTWWEWKRRPESLKRSTMMIKRI